MSDKEAPIFISYRRNPDEHAAGRLNAVLSDHFEGEVFFDIDKIDPGVDFTEKLESALDKCEIFVAVIGAGWADLTDDQGNIRLHEEGDFVRLEIASALRRRNVRVIPVLLDGAAMPLADKLPPDLQGLANRNAVELRHNRFEHEVKNYLIPYLEDILTSNWQLILGVGIFVALLIAYCLVAFLPGPSLLGLQADQTPLGYVGLVLALLVPPLIAMGWVGMRSRRLPDLRRVFSSGLLSYARIPAAILVLLIATLVVVDAEYAYADSAVAYVVVLPLHNDIAGPGDEIVLTGSVLTGEAPEQQRAQWQGPVPYVFVNEKRYSGAAALAEDVWKARVEALRAPLLEKINYIPNGEVRILAFENLLLDDGDPTTPSVVVKPVALGPDAEFKASYVLGNVTKPLVAIEKVLAKDEN